jgi:hypothetical protein
MSDLSPLSGEERKSYFRAAKTVFDGGLNRSAQHFVLEGKDGV